MDWNFMLNYDDIDKVLAEHYKTIYPDKNVVCNSFQDADSYTDSWGFDVKYYKLAATITITGSATILGKTIELKNETTVKEGKLFPIIKEKIDALLCNQDGYNIEVSSLEACKTNVIIHFKEKNKKKVLKKDVD